VAPYVMPLLDADEGIENVAVAPEEVACSFVP